MKDIISVINKNNLKSKLLSGNWGLEKENLRVKQDGSLAVTNHPKSLGDKLNHPYITTDFSESQIEVITPPQSSIENAYNLLENLHDIVTENIDEDEFLWPSSMPGIIPEDSQIPIADYGDTDQAKEKMIYREFIADKYGKHKQLICGIHYNFSFDDNFLIELHGIMDPDKDFISFKNDIYLTVSRNLLKYQWLITYLLGANIATHSSYKRCCDIDKFRHGDEHIFTDACSFRNSICGYRNTKDYRVSFDSLEENLHDLNKLISSGELKGVNEYYSPVRLKNTKDSNSLTALEKDGIEYIELRMIDLNPLSKVGIHKDDLYLVHLIIISSLLYPCSAYNEDDQAKAIEKQNFISLNGGNITKELRDEGLFFFSRLKTFLKSLSINLDKYNKIIESATAKLIGEEKLYSGLIYDRVIKEGYIKHHLNIAKNNKQKSLENKFSLKGYQDLELSTQILIKDSLLKGLKVEVLDRKENFISISNGVKIEYIKQATKTSLDSYATALIMENKAITKKVLIEQNISVPDGGIYTDIDSAINEFYNYIDKKIVIKPNNTNFGIGITILDRGFSNDDYIQGLKLAFSNDDTILIEMFFEGNEYRFTIIGGEVRGILQRVPANVHGDGKSTIKELIAIKNLNPLRGTGYVKPLEKIKLGESEILFIKQNGLTGDTIPLKGEIIYLRENSNISTGGDSLDFTDIIDQSYKVEAIRAAQAVNANITGVDMMIQDVLNPKTKDNSAIIELNFNPAIHIHCYPFKGVNRKLGVDVLTALGF